MSKRVDEFLISAAGVRMPRIIYGTAWKKEATAELVRTAIEQGFRGVDTACQPRHYDEAGVGEGVAAALGEQLHRADLYLQTKFTPVSGHDPHRIPYDPRAPLRAQVAQSFATSLRNLGTDYLDCLVLHSPLSRSEQTTEVWQAMEALVESGQARQLGISNCYSHQQLEKLHRTARVKPAVLQNRFYAETGYDRPLREFCQQHGITYQSFWTLTANPHVLAHPTTARLADKYQRTRAQIFFRFLTLEGIVPLTGTRSAAHMREDLEIFEFDIESSERREIRELLARA